MTQGKVLVLTVGTGNMEELEKSLLRPLAKSINDGEWREVLLLPSTFTRKFAAQLKQRFPALPVRVETLPEAAMENNADACFGHFDTVLEELLKTWEPGSITIDFTRGTKAMSAALVLAAIGHDISQLRYVWSDKRDERGTVVAGSENIGTFQASIATSRRQIDAARRFMGKGDFAAVEELLSDLAEPGSKTPPGTLRDLRKDARRLQGQARFYLAWDRLDYAKASQLAKNTGEEHGLDDAAMCWLHGLATKPKQEDHKAMAGWLRAVACDLLQNGRRRIKDGHFEDALLRGHRTRELVGQFLLFGHDIDSTSIDPKRKEIQHLKNNGGFRTLPNGRITASRFDVTQLLEAVGNPLLAELKEFDKKHGENTTNKRNTSILIHGFKVVPAKHPKSLHNLYDALEQLLGEADPAAAERIKTADLLSYVG